MKEERKNRYYKKILHLDKYIDFLSEWIGKRNTETLSEKLNFQELFGIYHAFQLAMEVVADLASKIAKDLSNIARDDYSNYQLLFIKKIISKEIHIEIKDLNGLRNRIVHDYTGLIDKVSLEEIKESITFLPNLKGEIEKGLSND